MACTCSGQRQQRIHIVKESALNKMDFSDVHLIFTTDPGYSQQSVECITIDIERLFSLSLEGCHLNDAILMTDKVVIVCSQRDSECHITS